MESMESVHLCRHNDSSALGEERFCDHRYPFSSIPNLRSHVQPHLVIYNLMDKLLSDRKALLNLNMNFDDEVSYMLRDILKVYRIWTNVPLPRTSRFNVNLRHALCPGFRILVDRDDGLANWDTPGIRDYKLASSPRSKAIIQKLEDQGVSEGSWSSLGSHDTGNYGEERFSHSLEDDKVWATAVRMWQSSQRHRGSRVI